MNLRMKGANFVVKEKERRKGCVKLKMKSEFVLSCRDLFSMAVASELVLKGIFVVCLNIYSLYIYKLNNIIITDI